MGSSIGWDGKDANNGQADLLGEEDFKAIVESNGFESLPPKHPIPCVVRRHCTDQQIRDMADGLFEYFQDSGDKHYSDTNPERIQEIYWDNVVERMIDDMAVEMSTEETEQFCDWFSDFYLV